MPFIETSAKSGQNVERVVVELVKEIRFRNLEMKLLFNYEASLPKDAKKKRQTKMASSKKEKDKAKFDAEEFEFYDAAIAIIKDAAKRADILKSVPAQVKTVDLARKTELLNLRGPLIDESEQLFEDYIAARGISTYPMQISLGVRLGDPVCDQYGVTLYENRAFFALADGCNWGPEPREAARKSNRTFIDYMKRYQKEFTNLRIAAHHMLRAYQIAHETIVEGRSKDEIWQAGTTAMLGGSLFECEQKDFPPHTWFFLAVSLGDCKTFHWDSQTKRVVDLTEGNRGNVTDARDPGGRLGPQVPPGEPDLRNLEVFWAPVKKDDIILCLTDGVYDNFDPQHLGKVPADLGINAKTWSEIDGAKDKDLYNETAKKKSAFALNAMNELLSKCHHHNAHEFTQALIDHCRKLTITTRQFMEANPEKGLPKDYVAFPGKVDHTTCLAIKVGLRGAQYVREKKDVPHSKVAPFSPRWDFEVYDKIEENKIAARPKPEPPTTKQPAAPDMNQKITLKRDLGRNTLRGALKKEMSTRKIDDSALWKRMQTDTGEIFFFHTQTGQSTWEDPTAADLLPGWKVFYDDEGDPYYFNSKSGKPK